MSLVESINSVVNSTSTQTSEAYQQLSDFAKEHGVCIGFHNPTKTSHTVVSDTGNVYTQTEDSNEGLVKTFPITRSSHVIGGDGEYKMVTAYAKHSSALIDDANTDVTNGVDMDGEPDSVPLKKQGSVYAASEPLTVMQTVKGKLPSITQISQVVTKLPRALGSGLLVAFIPAFI